MMKPMKRFLALLFLAASPSLAFDNLFDFNFGRGLPMSELQAGGSSDHAGSLGTAWSADLLHMARPGLYVGLGGGQFRSNDNESSTYLANASTIIRSRSSQIMILTRQDLTYKPDAIPYVIEGIGWVQNSVVMTSRPNTTWADTGTNEQRTLVHDTNNTVGFAIGAGMDFNLTNALFAGAEVRYQRALNENFKTTPAGLAATGQSDFDTPLKTLFYTVKLGLRY